jgi:hypothetical protein
MTEPQLWIGDGKLLDAPGCAWGAAVVELLTAPALDSGQDAARVAQEHRQLAERIIRGLRSWENAGSLELRYIWGKQSGSDRLRLLLIGRAVGQTLDIAHTKAQQMLQNVGALVPPGYEFGPLQGPLSLDTMAWAEIERTEETRTPGPFVPPGMVDYYYLLHPLGGSGRSWPNLPKALASIDEPGFLSIVLAPTRMTDHERQVIDHISSQARYLAEPQQTCDFFGNQITNPADAGAQAVHFAWQRFPERSGLLARIGIAAHPSQLHRIASLIGSIITEGSDQSANPTPNKFKIVSDISEYDAFQTSTLGVVLPRRSHEVWSMSPEDAPISVERMLYFFSEEEAGGLFVLPVPDEQGVPGVPRARRAVARRETVADQTTEPGIRIGAALHHGQVSSSLVVPLRALNQHTLVVGASGWGKTTTVLSMLAELWREHHVPFFAIEPTKTEYRTLLETPGFADLKVIVLGRDDIAPLRLNPLAPPPGVRREVHANTVLASLRLALPLQPPLPQLLDEAIDRTYELAGWDFDTTSDEGLTPPTMRSLLDSFEFVFAQKGYIGEAKNIGVAFCVRLATLLRGSRGRVLDTVESVDFGDLMCRPVVVELDEITDNEDKAIFAAFLLDRIRAAARSRGSSGGHLQHLTVIEEAHRLLARSARSARYDSGDSAQSDTVQVFCDAIAELRSYGEGFILSTQSPSDLAQAALRNTATRIVHRLEQAADRNAVLDDLDASQLDRESAARLQKGEAIARWPGRDEAELIMVRVADEVDSGRKTSNETVAERMATETSQVRRLLPYALCTREVCKTGCIPSLRHDGQQLALALGAEANRLWKGANGTVTALTPIMKLLAHDAGGDAQLTYCIAAHMAANRDAFHVQRRVDIRPQLIEAVRQAVKDP